MQQRRGERENGRQTSGGRQVAGVDTARQRAAYAHGACREAVHWPLRHSETDWQVRRPCALVHCTWPGRVIASLTVYPLPSARGDRWGRGVAF